MASESSTKETILEQIIDVVGEHALDTVSPTTKLNIPIPPAPATPADDDFIPSCITQNPIPKALRNTKNKNLGAIMVGLNRECPRWVPGSVLKWVVVKEGFRTPADADYAAQHLHMACQKWNEFNVGVTFEWVTKPADATFALWHGGSQGGVLASAFFPNPNDMSNMLVYNAAFAMPKWKANLWKVFMHELGHVLGLRHEFAMDRDPETGNSKETFKAVQLGPRNENSVMTYGRNPPEVQDSDVESARAFYALKDDENGNSPMIGLTPVQDYEPM
ncbi:putative matrix metalloproteinase-11 protein [Fusarium austroafricanum]|uniref:Putative matrix metalloproteinase-11 protein n=1 Tax=Fusarium austroafricanum TaxID=2364996 RepID=A0A8H4NWF9_9HYPO|nr:putative matrix metalloproteinase-11 protein [Fusarium austroafricanum]